ncbi:MAG: hypothetical protein AB2A00_21220 [Myxococcota bacterium]
MFRSISFYPRIAGCGGGFQVPGIHDEAAPTCGREAGDDGTRPDGEGCSAGDLCAEGWHVCRSENEVAQIIGSACRGATDAEGAVFYATRQSGTGCGNCAMGTDSTCSRPDDCRRGCADTAVTTNDVFGCGTLGAQPTPTQCGVLNRSCDDLCSGLVWPWQCSGQAGEPTPEDRESLIIVKPGPEAGGVLCCRD